MLTQLAHHAAHGLWSARGVGAGLRRACERGSGGAGDGRKARTVVRAEHVSGGGRGCAGRGEGSTTIAAGDGWH